MLDWLNNLRWPSLSGGPASLSPQRAQVLLAAASASIVTAGSIFAFQSYRRKHYLRQLKDELLATVDTPASTLQTSRLNQLGLPMSPDLPDLVGADDVHMDKGGNFPTGATTITQSTTTHPEFLVREQLARNIAFLGEDGVARLRRARVVVVGAGGVGSWATVMLARSGVEYIRVIDFDQVTLSSLNRHAVATLADVGTPKVVALKNRLAQVTPQVTIDARVTLFDKSSAPTLLEGGDRGPIDMVLDCIDHIDTKLELLHYCHTHQLPVISAMGAGAKCDPSRVQISDISETFEDPLARAVRRSLKKMGVNGGIPVVYSTEKPGQVRLLPLDESRVADADEFAVLPDFRARILPVLGTLPAIFGMAMATYVICQLAAFPLEPLAIKQRDALYHRLHRDLCNRDGHHHHHQKGVPLSQDDVAYSFEEIWRGRSVISGSFEKPALTRWHHDQPLSLQNCVCMTKHEASIHDALTVPPEEYYPSDVVERVQARFREEMRLGQWR